MPQNVFNNRPVLLLPVRLETRFIGDDLWVRIYPDQIHIGTHEPRLTENEFEAGLAYVEKKDKGEEIHRAGWRELARRFGPERAAWIAKETSAWVEKAQQHVLDILNRPRITPDKIVHVFDRDRVTPVEPVEGSTVVSREQQLLDLLNEVKRAERVAEYFRPEKEEPFVEIGDLTRRSENKVLQILNRATNPGQIINYFRGDHEREQQVLHVLNSAARPDQVVAYFRRGRTALITPDLATRILSVRRTRPGQRFRSLAEVAAVPGLSQQRVKGMLNLVRGARPSHARSITPAQAQRILIARHSHPNKRFRTFREVAAIPGIGPKTLKHMLDVAKPSRPARVTPVNLEGARQILMARQSLPGQKFRLLTEVAAIAGIGEAGLKQMLAMVKIFRPAGISPITRELAQQLLIARNKRPEKRFNAIADVAAVLGISQTDLQVIFDPFYYYPKPEFREKEEGWMVIPKLMGLPYRFAVYLYSDDKLVSYPGFENPKYGNPVPKDLTMLGDPSNSQGELFDAKSKWIVDRNQAEDDGMAIRINLAAIPKKDRTFSRLIVVGIRSPSSNTDLYLVKHIIDSHHYSTGFGLVDYGTPTNNTEKGKSGHSRSREDYDARYEAEIQEIPGTQSEPWQYAQKSLAFALGEFYLPGFTGSKDNTGFFAKEMRTALWPVSGEYLLRHLLPGIVENNDHLDKLGEHFIQFVDARGPFPTIRVGDQPYGVLPVTGLRQWKPSLFDYPGPDRREPIEGAEIYTKVDQKLHEVLTSLYQKWFDLAGNPLRVPRVRPIGDDPYPDATLLKILAMEPLSISYRVRPFVHQDFVNWLLIALRNYAFGPNGPNGPDDGPAKPYHDLVPSPLYWVQRWDQEWKDHRQEQAILWNNLTDMSVETFKNSRLLQLLAWWNAKALEIPLVRHDDLNHSEPKTLLGDLLKRSLNSQLYSSITPSMVREAISSLAENFNTQESEPKLERLFRQTLDLCTHRLDAWITSLATKRLYAMRSIWLEGSYLGAYGWVEDLKPAGTAQSEGYIHAPSSTQAKAAAVLHNAYLTHRNGSDANPFRINLSSERVRQALRIIEGMRQGQPLGALLGYQFERALHDSEVYQLDQYIDDFRAAFPLVANKETPSNNGDSVEAIAARNVVDGLTLVRWWENPERTDITVGDIQDVEKIKESGNDNNGDPAGETDEKKKEQYRLLRKEMERLQNTHDAVSDLMMYEGVYQAAQGNYERGGATLEAASGNAHPPEIESVVTPVTGKSLGHRVCLLFPPRKSHGSQTAPRATAEPRLAVWFSDLLGDLDTIGCRYEFKKDDEEHPQTGTASLARLNISAIDLLYMAATPLRGDKTEQTEIEQHIACFVRKKYWLKHTTRVEIEFARSGDFTYGIGEALELGRQVLDTLGAGNLLRPGSLCLPAEADNATYNADDVRDLKGRVEAVYKPFSDLKDSGLEIIEWLFTVSQYGVSGAIPLGLDDPEIETRIQNVLGELGKREQAFQKAWRKAFPPNGVNEEPPPPDRQIAILIEAMKALFGSSFIVFPTFVPYRGEPLSQAMAQTNLLNGLGDERVRLWLQQASQTHLSLRQLEDSLTMAEAWRQPTERAEESALTLQVAQLPFDEKNRWLALDDHERGKSKNTDLTSDRGALSIVAAVASSQKLTLNVSETSGNDDERVAGLLLDQWDERIPCDTVNTSMGFQYNGPNAQAPQSLLLAVPSERPTQAEDIVRGKEWTEKDLAEIVKDTMDLAKVRAVDLDVMGEIEGDDKEEQLFSVTAPTPSELGELDNKVVPTRLNDGFTNKGETLKENPDVNVVTKGSKWRIQGQSRVFIVKKENDTLYIYSLEQGVGLIFPSLLFPTNAEQTGWPETALSKSIEEWVNALLRLGDALYQPNDMILAEFNLYQSAGSSVKNAEKCIEFAEIGTGPLHVGGYRQNVYHEDDQGGWHFPEWTKVLVSYGGQGIRIILPESVPGVRVKAGWLAPAPLAHRVVVLDENSNPLDARVADFPTGSIASVRLCEGDVPLEFQVEVHEVFSPIIKIVDLCYGNGTLETIGSCFLIEIKTYSYS